MIRGNKWHPIPSISLFFWSRVERLEAEKCWEWKGTKYSTGYGDCRKKYAHRVSWELNRGEVPAGKHVLHKCDNPTCVNPAHLYVGGNKENRRDACDRARYPGGAKSSRAILTSDQVYEIKRLHKEKLSNHSRAGAARELAKLYPVGEIAIRDILAGKRWSHIKSP